MNVIFMGTPAFAVPALEALINSPHLVCAVFCQPDRPKGRSKKPQPCPVKIAAIQAGIPVFQPERIRKRSWRKMLEEFNSDVFVVAAYGQILSQKIIDAPKVDCINLHASILPRWRGASPIHSAILHGDPETGVSLMRIEKELDAGPVYQTVKTPVIPREARLELETRLAKLGAELLIQVLPSLETRNPVPQSHEGVTFSPIIQKKDGYIKMEEHSINVERKLSALGDWPGVWCKFRGKPIKIVSAQSMNPTEKLELELNQHVDSLSPGQLFLQGKKRLTLKMGSKSYLELLELQLSGKKPQPIQAFINGYQPQTGDFFEEGD